MASLSLAASPATVTPEKRTNTWWVDRHQEKLAEVKNGKIDFIMLGDSITQAWEKQKFYPSCFYPNKVLNLGYGGDRTQHALWRIQNGEIDGLSPKLVTIMLGTNNISRDEPEDIAQGLKAVVTELRQRLPDTEIALLSVFPRDHPRIKGDRELTQKLNALLPALAVQEKVTFHNFEPHYLNDDGSLNAELYGKDLLHLNNKGYETWAKALAPVLKQAGLEIKAQEASQNQEPVAASTGTNIVRLWPIDRIGGEENRLKEEYRERNKGNKQLCGVKDPNLTFYPAKSNQPSPAVIYSPGGGYGILALPSQSEIKSWNDLGISLIVFKYTIPKQYDAAFQDIQRAVRTVRHQAEKWNIDPKRIGLFGNSAGGHLSARLMNNFDQNAYDPIDEIDKESAEPNFAILQCSAYFNGIPRGEALDQTYFHLKHKVAPTFLTYAKDDIHYPGGQNYTDAMKKAGYPIHLKTFEKGGHGMKNCDWFSEATAWMKENNFIK